MPHSIAREEPPPSFTPFHSADNREIPIQSAIANHLPEIVHSTSSSPLISGRAARKHPKMELCKLYFLVKRRVVNKHHPNAQKKAAC